MLKLIYYCRNGSSFSPEVEFDVLKSSETDRKSDALTVQRAFVTSTKVLVFSEYHFYVMCYYLAHPHL
jgi:hypothetical protein